MSNSLSSSGTRACLKLNGGLVWRVLPCEFVLARSGMSGPSPSLDYGDASTVRLELCWGLGFQIAI